MKIWITVLLLGVLGLNLPAQAQYQLYGNDGTYLGNTNPDPYDYNSIHNPFGPYGSRYGKNSIHNTFGNYSYQQPSIEQPRLPNAYHNPQYQLQNAYDQPEYQNMYRFSKHSFSGR